MKKLTDYMEFREVDASRGDYEDAHEEVYFLGVHVQTIRNTGTRPGGHVYVEREQAVKRAEKALKHLWNLVGEATPETADRAW
jgi:hypothetical protein